MRIALASLVWIGCGTDVPSQHDGTSPPAGSNAVDVYADSCAQCHGPDGDGTVDAPQIRNPVHGYATYVIRHGRASEMGFPGDMPAFSEGEIADLAPVFAWLERGAHPTDGQALYVRYCGNCHGADAQGGRVGEDITHETDELEEKVREGHGGTNYAARTKYMPAWSTGELSDAEVAAIEAYVRTLPAGPGDDGD